MYLVDFLINDSAAPDPSESWAWICKRLRSPGIESDRLGIDSWTRICKPFREPRNRFPAWRIDSWSPWTFTNPGSWKGLKIRALIWENFPLFYFCFFFYAFELCPEIIFRVNCTIFPTSSYQYLNISHHPPSPHTIFLSWHTRHYIHTLGESERGHRPQVSVASPSPGVYIDGGGGGGGSMAADGMKPKKIQLEEGKPDSENQPFVGKNAASYDGKQ